MRWNRQNLFIIAAISLYRGVRYSGVCFHIFYCNSAGLSYVVRYNGVFVIAGFVIAGCHCNPLVSKIHFTFEKLKKEHIKKYLKTEKLFRNMYLKRKSQSFHAQTKINGRIPWHDLINNTT